MKIICKICNSKFDNHILLNKHLVKDHNKKPVEYQMEHGTVTESVKIMYEKINTIFNKD